MTIEVGQAPGGVGGPAPPEAASLLANSSFMLLARAFTLLSGGALIVYAARVLSVTEYGQYTVAVALMAIFGLLSEMGISALALREMSPPEARLQHILGVALGAELVTTVVAAAALVPTGIALGYSTDVLALLAIAAGVLLCQGLLPPIDAAFKARRVLIYSAELTFVQSAVTAVAGFALVALGAGAAGLLAALLLGSAAALPVGLVLLKRRLKVFPSFEGTWSQVGPFLLASAPIAITGALTAVYDRVDVVMVSTLDDAAAAAVYGIPLAIVQYAMLVPMIIGTAFFALFANALRDDRPAARSSFFLVSRLFVFASVPIAMVLAAGGTDIVTLLFGDHYEPSGEVLALLGWNVILGFQILLFWYGLLAAHHERRMAGCMTIGLALNVALNFWLIPSYGPRGAAISLIVSDAFVLVTQVVLLQRNVFPVSFRQVLLKPLVAAALAIPLMLFLSGYSGVLAGTIAALLFIGLLLAGRYISGDEWQPLTQPVMRVVRRVF